MCAKEINEKNRHSLSPIVLESWFVSPWYMMGNPLTRFLVIIERSAVLDYYTLHLSALSSSTLSRRRREWKKQKNQAAASSHHFMYHEPISDWFPFQFLVGRNILGSPSYSNRNRRPIKIKTSGEMVLYYYASYGANSCHPISVYTVQDDTSPTVHELIFSA